MLLLQQFHLEHIQSLAEALMTLTAGECVTERERRGKRLTGGQPLENERMSNGED